MEGAPENGKESSHSVHGNVIKIIKNNNKSCGIDRYLKISCK
jgi:hypothetical protein